MSIDERISDALFDYCIAWRDRASAVQDKVETELRAAIERYVAEAVVRETERLRGALLTLANAADDVGVQFFDMEDPPISVAQMESATLAARAALAATEAKP